MTTNELLELDCRIEGNKAILQKALKMLKPFTKYEEDIPTESLEKVIFAISRKYEISIKEVYPAPFSNKKETIWHATIINDARPLDAYCVHGISIYEVLCKSIVKMHSMLKKNEVKERK
jgi:hypothetical protein